MSLPLPHAARVAACSPSFPNFPHPRAVSVLLQTKALFDRYDNDGSGFLSYEEVRVGVPVWLGAGLIVTRFFVCVQQHPLPPARLGSPNRVLRLRLPLTFGSPY